MNAPRMRMYAAVVKEKGGATGRSAEFRRRIEEEYKRLAV